MSITQDRRTLATKQKALTINLNECIYGSFAEIGAGQDVAGNFFKAGGASGTIAKTMSAYDMIYSDAIYGVSPDKRYVSEARLMSMLNHEYGLLIERLANQRGNRTTFFAFADTVSALNYKKTNDAHGWIGVRFQLTPNGEYNDVILHVKLLDNDNNLQQQAIGILGVNLMYACFHYQEDASVFMNSLMDDLTRDRIQIDMIRFVGPDFAHVDNRLMSLRLVKSGFSDVAVFGPDGKNLPPTDALYKKHIVVMRGRFRPMVNVHSDMLTNGVKQFLEEPDVDKKNVVVLLELTLQALKERNANPEDDIDEKDFLDRVDILCSLGQTVMISNYHEYYKLVAYLSKITRLKIGMVLGYPNLEYIFSEEHYKELPGGILESFATLFSRKVKLFIYPTLRNGIIQNCLRFFPPPHLIDLYRYLIANNKIEDITHYNELNLQIQTDDVLGMIKTGKEGWENLVPAEVASIIKERHLFGLPHETVTEKEEIKTAQS
ncbi:nicotinate-nucleotide adenylyltransferase [Arachidicoccus ginsenosidimutans]|uniref:nicotinate-nucleotide adenylyltransferase n=1 Tax=Arachidicoccus sp. BS20 TaxID=1850526 RepID=UPI0007F0916D|nr:nicotinate-nucleotide adenylyltransferase [Arachidicoccus sp. BS20]ANI89717.1 nicotinate-nucleotide adenylyltransferase [Arachidicoccus sp. BS20]